MDATREHGAALKVGDPVWYYPGPPERPNSPRFPAVVASTPRLLGDCEVVRLEALGDDYRTYTCSSRTAVPCAVTTHVVPRISLFSGQDRLGMWNAVNDARTVKDVRRALYKVCCRLQQLEEALSQALSQAGKPLR